MHTEWEKAAKKLKKQVMIAAWDTERGNPPPIIGQIQGTPTIKIFTPKGKKNKKAVSDYNGERKAKAIASYVQSLMPNFVERVNGAPSFEAFVAKADKYGLPKVLLFSKASSTKPLIKALSTEYRRRLLIAEIRATAANKAIIEEYNVSDFPTLLVIKEDGSQVKFEKQPTFNRLNNFLGDHALKKAAKKKKKEEL